MGPPWPCLAEFLASLNSTTPGASGTDYDYPVTDEERLTTVVVVCCYQAALAGVDVKQRDTIRGSASIEASHKAGSLLRDDPVAAMVQELGGLTDLAENRLDDAERRMADAAKRWTRLAKRSPAVYRGYLANAWHDQGRVAHEKGNSEGGCQAYEQALVIRQELAQQWPGTYRSCIARTVTNLGNARSDLNQLEAAEASHREALDIHRELARVRPEVYRPDVYRPDVANTLNNLGVVQSDLNQLEAAEASHREALDIRRELARLRPDVAMALNNLGNLQSDLNQLEAAEASYREALETYRELARVRPEVYRPGVAMTLIGLGNVQRALNQLEAAEATYREASQLYELEAQRQPTSHLIERRKCFSSLGWTLHRHDAARERPDYPGARLAFRQARHCAELYRSLFRNPDHRNRVLAESIAVYDGLIHACVGVWEQSHDPEALQEAVEVAEASRARYLLDLLADELLRPAHTTDDEFAAYTQVRRRLEQAQRRLMLEQESSKQTSQDRSDPTTRSEGSEQRLSWPGKPPTRPPVPSAPPRRSRLIFLEEELQQAQMDHAEALVRVQLRDPLFNPDQPVAPVTLAQARGLMPDSGTVLVQLNFVESEGYGFLITHKEVRMVRLPGMSKGKALEKASVWMRRYQTLRGQGPDWRNAWGALVPGLLEDWSTDVMQPVLCNLPADIRRLVLSSTQASQLIPLHACRMADGWFVSDAFEVVYALSLSLLHRCARLQRSGPSRELLVQDPTSNLTFAPAEGDAFHHLHPKARVLAQGEARRETIMPRVGNAVFSSTAGTPCWIWKIHWRRDWFWRARRTRAAG